MSTLVLGEKQLAWLRALQAATEAEAALSMDEYWHLINHRLITNGPGPNVQLTAAGFAALAEAVQ